MSGEKLATTKHATCDDHESIPRFVVAPNTPEISQAPFLLSLVDGKLTLNQMDIAPPRQLTIDFTTDAIQQRLQTFGKKHPLAKAIGLHKLKSGQAKPSIIDATAGLGRDGFILACLGCQVQLIEQSALLHALLQDGLERAMMHAEFAHLQNKLQLIHGDSLDILPQFANDPAAPDVIYLDPMFPERRKSALVKKELQMLQALLGKPTNHNEADLLQAALIAAKHRVVVKRPKSAANLACMAPDYSVTSPSMRYDVYLTRTK